MLRAGEHVTGDVRGDQGHLGPTGRGLRGERDALPTARAIAEVAHGVDGLARATGRDGDPPPGEVTGREQREGGIRDVLRFDHASWSAVATGQLADGRADDVHSTALQGGD